ncbi:MAG: DUF1844 domain-containing protein, partial [Planctomycetota bacterium]
HAPHGRTATMADEGETPKILVDDDWKNQAQAEKAKLAEEEAAREAEGDQPQQGKLPPADFRGLVGMLASQAIMYMGGMAHPESGQPIFDPDTSAHLIDLLGVLQEKTKGNLSDEESQELDTILQELRARFVELIQVVAKQQGAGPGAPPAVGGEPAGGASSIITP